MLHHSLEALRMTGIMAWQILWALSLGFLLSSIVEAVVSKAQLSRLLPDSSPKTILKATALGAASSSCSYAATALARTLFRKGADFIAAMAFQFALPIWSSNSAFSSASFLAGNSWLPNSSAVPS